MRALLLLSALLASNALGARYALLVGVDRYGFIQEPTKQLRGAQTDTDLMRRMLDFYGFRTTILLREGATSAGIGKELKAIYDGLQPGDHALFYFSGRGSMAETANLAVRFEPSLVPFDGQLDDDTNDVRVRWIEDWARGVASKNAHATVILDSSFQDLARADYGRQYNPTPRCLNRPSEGATPFRIYGGPGVFLSACPPQGAAYEWLANASEERWGGAFTDQLVNAVVAALNRGESPTAVDAMREVQAYFKDKSRADYMPGLAPFPFMDQLIAESRTYDQPLFGGVDPKALPAGSKASLAAMEKARQERERKLRVGLEVLDASSEAERQKLYDRSSKALADYLKKRVPGSELAPTGAPPDVVVKVKPYQNQLEASVTGDDLDKDRVFLFRAKDVGKALSDGLGSYLELRGLVTRLYRLSASQPPTWKSELKMQSDGTTYSRGETFGLDITAPPGALLYVLDRDDADGVLQLAFPQPGAPYPQKVPGSLRMGGQLQPDTSTGRMMLRAIVVDPGSTKIPEVTMKDEKKFRDSLIKQLRVVVDGMESNKIAWTSQTINLRIR